MTKRYNLSSLSTFLLPLLSSFSLRYKILRLSFYLIHMRGLCDRLVDSEHESRVPVPIQVASSASRRITPLVFILLFFFMFFPVYISCAWILFRSDLFRYAFIYGRYFSSGTRVPFYYIALFKEIIEFFFYHAGKFQLSQCFYSLFLFFRSIYFSRRKLIPFVLASTEKWCWW